MANINKEIPLIAKMQWAREHDVKIGNHCHISTGVIINGSVEIGDNCFIGSGSVLSNNIKIKDNSFVKMGSLIKK